MPKRKPEVEFPRTAFRSPERPLSTRLHWTAEYFRFTSYLGGILVVGGLVGLAVGVRPSRPAMFVAGVLAGAVSAVSWWLTSHALHQRRRIGGWFALASFIPPLAHAALTGGRPTLTLVIPALGVLAILTSWRELE